MTRTIEQLRRQRATVHTVVMGILAVVAITLGLLTMRAEASCAARGGAMLNHELWSPCVRAQGVEVAR